ncbi:16686_t:CDS:2 [Cetraspora pellucida]|uniref:16686_t:CDS:1 n=1 Tax=Cetraspora pellucida TaxID=1433469 RepID=A0A9N8ZTQ1_9GLOM|nr:16686_t:CDS:2 [Cetraspora pellucida]
MQEDKKLPTDFADEVFKDDSYNSNVDIAELSNDTSIINLNNKM